MLTSVDGGDSTGKSNLHIQSGDAMARARKVW